MMICAVICGVLAGAAAGTCLGIAMTPGLTQREVTRAWAQAALFAIAAAVFAAGARL